MLKHDDSLVEMFSLREDFMEALNEKTDIYPQWPLDVTKKKSQQILRESVLRGVEEMFEALQELKNSKPHRQTEITHFDREAFLEENVDALNYFLTTLILVGVTPNDLLEGYRRKHKIIMKRLEEGY
jgi:hypothetical protein